MPERPPPQPRRRTERGLALEGPRARVEELVARAGAGSLRFGRPRTERVRERWFDTDGGTLAAVGLTFALRERGDGVDLRLSQRPEPPIAGTFTTIHRSQPLEAPLSDPPELLGTPLAAQVKELCAGEALAPQLVLETRIVTRRIALDAASLGARFELGESTAPAGALELARVVLRQARGDAALVFRVATQLLEAVPELRPVREDPPRLLSRLRGVAPATAPVRPLALPRKATLADLVDAILSECLRGVALNEAAARLEAGVEGVHQMRVAVRRLRVALRLLRNEIGRARAARLRAALAPVADALGAVRDLDVLLERIAHCEGAGDEALGRLREAALRERSAAFAALAQLLDSPERAQLDLELGALVFGRDWHGSAPAERLASRARGAARALAERTDRRALRAGKRFAELTDPQRHQLRLRAKAARYATELLAPLLPERRTRRYLRRARALQDALGAECDARRIEAFALRLAADDASRVVALLLDRGATAAQLRDQSARAWRRFRRARRPWV
jgi:CHAD domain-containing protein